MKHQVLIQEAQALPSINSLREDIWSLKAPSKIKNFLWRAISGSIHVVDKLLTRKIRIDYRCQIYGLEGESINHVLFVCTAARQVWVLTDIPIPENGFYQRSVYLNFYHLLMVGKNNLIPLQIRRLVHWLVWTLWKNKNNLVFERKRFLAMDIVEKIIEDAENWFMAQQVESRIGHDELQPGGSGSDKWKAPPNSWVKCNVGSVWSNEKKIKRRRMGLEGFQWNNLFA